jgi:lipid-A-disaccharide synthase
MSRLRLYLIAGEASGDLHGSNLMKELVAESGDQVDFRFWGGDKMKEVAGEPAKHIRDLAFMGFIEVLMNLRTILRNIKFCKQDILDFKPDALVLIDYPGFNLRIAKWAKENGIKVYYYISPQIWAWKESRIHEIKRNVDHMFVILPFEKDFYGKHGMKVEYVGHPLLDAVQNYRTQTQNNTAISTSDKKIIAVLPGSRKQEVSIKLPIMLEALSTFTEYEVIVAGAPSLEEDFYKPYLNERVRLVKGRTYDILMAAEAAVVTSGTATLEAALLGVPEVVCYKGSAISYHIARRLIKVKYISLVNLILDKESVVELIQDECNPIRIREELGAVLDGGSRREKVMKDYDDLKTKLGGGGASKKVAQSLLKTIHFSVSN